VLFLLLFYFFFGIKNLQFFRKSAKTKLFMLHSGSKRTPLVEADAVRTITP